MSCGIAFSFPYFFGLGYCKYPQSGISVKVLPYATFFNTVHRKIICISGVRGAIKNNLQYEKTDEKILSTVWIYIYTACLPNCNYCLLLSLPIIFSAFILLQSSAPPLSEQYSASTADCGYKPDK